MRGQVYPIWLATCILTLICAFFIGSYGNVIAYQYRAQTAADSMAYAAVAMQSQQFNQMTEALYGATVEEYRLRSLLESLRTTAGHSGGCGVSGPDCATVWLNLQGAYRRSLTRYDADARVLNRIATSTNYASLQGDINQLLNTVNTLCANPGSSAFANGFNCGSSGTNFNFQLRALEPMSDMGDVYGDSLDWQFYLNPTDRKYPLNQTMFAPIAVEVEACANVPPLFPLPLGLAGQPAIVIALGAAVDNAVEIDAFSPGGITNPSNNQVFQPTEVYGPIDSSNLINWYNVNFGVIPMQVAGNFNSTFDAQYQALDVRLTWWAPTPYAPFIHYTNNRVQSTCP